MNPAAYEHPLAKYIRPSAKTTANCPGCGNGILAQSILRAIEALGLTLDDFVFVSGIGCSAWIPSPSFYADVLHTTHGRPIAFATGLKVALPEKRAMVISGDGDLTAIGGNHLIHACRRNIDLTCILFNNQTYGMTGGQTSPTMGVGDRSTTARRGQIEPPFDLCRLAEAAGASFVARGTAGYIRGMEKLIKRGIQHKGFAFIEAVVPCPTEYGRRQGRGNVLDMLDDERARSISRAKAAQLPPEERAGRIVTGVLHEDTTAPEFQEVHAASARAHAEAAAKALAEEKK